jgi:hypothetical protein
VIVTVHVFEAVIVAVHLNGNATVAVIRSCEGAASESTDSGSDHLHGGVHVHVHGQDHGPTTITYTTTVASTMNHSSHHRRGELVTNYQSAG